VRAYGRPDTPCFVYRCYDAAGVLLYIGLTSRLEKRMKEHRQQDEWGPEIVHMRVQPYSDERKGGDVEKSQIWYLQPRHNRMFKHYEPWIVRGRPRQRTKPQEPK
jgi:excinuclease UvrABC nuclease subunit